MIMEAERRGRVNYYECIQSSIDYIENNLKRNIEMEDIARQANFSIYYFFRIFNGMVGEPVKEYIRKRRLSEAAMDIINTNKKILDIAFDYGFESQESFTRAFKKMHGITPGKCREYKNHINFYEKINLNDIKKKGDMMEYRIIEMNEMKLIGVEKAKNYRDGRVYEITLLWDRWKSERLCEKIENRVKSGNTYGIHYNIKENGDFTYRICVEVNEFDYIPNGFIGFTLPSAKYAVFKTKLSELGKFWENFYGVWLPSTGYEQPNCVFSNYRGWNFSSVGNLELYAEDFDVTNEIEIYVPIK